MAAARRKVELIATPEKQHFFSSGCALLDCVLGGGWAHGRTINIVGDKSTGKTLLAIEACANFVRANPNSKVKYVEAESAFDPSYAATIGFPETNLDLIDDVSTVEGMWEVIDKAIEESNSHPQLVVLDSLDALSDDEEMKRDVGEATYGMAKGKLLSEGFRKYIRNMTAANLTLMVISQIRDKVSTMANAKKVQRSGGHALDFYASQVLWLYEVGKIKKTVGGLERAIGVDIKARLEKSKVGWPWRECQVPIIYGYGMEDAKAAFEWVATVAPERLSHFDTDNTKFTKDNWKRHYAKIPRSSIDTWIKEVWETVDKQFRPESRKYE